MADMQFQSQQGLVTRLSIAVFYFVVMIDTITPTDLFFLQSLGSAHILLHLLPILLFLIPRKLVRLFGRLVGSSTEFADVSISI